MSTRTAAIIIDDFLSNEKWEWIQSNLSEYLNTSEFIENRNEPYVTTIKWIKERLNELDLFQEHWNSNLDMWSFINTLPPNIDRESTGRGYHIDMVDLYIILIQHGTHHGEVISNLKIVM